MSEYIILDNSGKLSFLLEFFWVMKLSSISISVLGTFKIKEATFRI